MQRGPARYPKGSTADLGPTGPGVMAEKNILVFKTHSYGGQNPGDLCIYMSQELHERSVPRIVVREGLPKGGGGWLFGVSPCPSGGPYRVGGVSCHAPYLARDHGRQTGVI